jgi:hypothetical protein
MTVGGQQEASLLGGPAHRANMKKAPEGAAFASYSVGHPPQVRTGPQSMCTKFDRE